MNRILQSRNINSHLIKLSRKKENGFILITGLILLMILTLIVLYSMGSSIVQEKSSGGITDRKVAFQNAETALRYAENYVFIDNLSANLFTSTCDNGLCLPSTTATPVWKNINWATDTAHTISLPANTIPNVLQQPKFIVEILGPVPSPSGESLKNNSSNSQGVAYRITVYATGNRGSSVAQVQSVFAKR